MRKIAIVGFKGGIGKTTTCVNLGAGLARRGRRVLLIDTDMQANLSISLGIVNYKRSLADVLGRRIQAEECVLSARENLDLLPSSIALFKAQQSMVLEMAREEIFMELFAGLGDYDYQLLDCAPSVSLLTINAVAYVEEVFIPVSMEMLALAGQAGRCRELIPSAHVQVDVERVEPQGQGRLPPGEEEVRRHEELHDRRAEDEHRSAGELDDAEDDGKEGCGRETERGQLGGGSVKSGATPKAEQLPGPVPDEDSRDSQPENCRSHSCGSPLSGFPAGRQDRTTGFGPTLCHCSGLTLPRFFLPNPVSRPKGAGCT